MLARILVLTIACVVAGCIPPSSPSPAPAPAPAPGHPSSPTPGSPPVAACDGGAAVVTGDNHRGVVVPALDVTACRLTFSRALASCLVTFHTLHTFAGDGLGPGYEWTTNVLTVTAAPNWSLPELEYDCDS